MWQTFMLPDYHGKLGGYASAAIWGSSPFIDKSRISKCQEEENNQTIPTHPDQCIELVNHLDSFIALDLDSGEIKWYQQPGGYDAWFFAYNLLSNPSYPLGPNPDANFGESPMLLTTHVNGTKINVVVATQKSGFVWALDRDNGDIIWSTVAMDASTGEIIWSMANPSNATSSGPVTVANGVVFAESTNRK
ncbi:hypothetical protein Ancab_019904 [Ancistrocladus abbreviatus]